jgi:hypothetical protein
VAPLAAKQLPVASQVASEWLTKSDSDLQALLTTIQQPAALF